MVAGCCGHVPAISGLKQDEVGQGGDEAKNPVGGRP
jgi:hypothetical protein